MTRPLSTAREFHGCFKLNHVVYFNGNHFSWLISSERFNDFADGTSMMDKKPHEKRNSVRMFKN